MQRLPSYLSYLFLNHLVSMYLLNQFSLARAKYSCLRVPDHFGRLVRSSSFVLKGLQRIMVSPCPLCLRSHSYLSTDVQGESVMVFLKGRCHAQATRTKVPYGFLGYPVRLYGLRCRLLAGGERAVVASVDNLTCCPMMGRRRRWSANATNHVSGIRSHSPESSESITCTYE